MKRSKKKIPFRDLSAPTIVIRPKGIDEKLLDQLSTTLCYLSDCGDLSCHECVYHDTRSEDLITFIAGAME